MNCVTPRVRATYFPDESQLDAVDYFALLNWERRGQRVNSLVRADFSEQDTVRSEQPSVDSGGGLGQPDIGDAELREVLSSNLCRCTGYQNILKAVRAAAAQMRSARPGTSA